MYHQWFKYLVTSCYENQNKVTYIFGRILKCDFKVIFKFYDSYIESILNSFSQLIAKKQLSLFPNHV